MRYQFLLVPVAVVASVPAVSETYLSVEEAQQRIFPGATFTEHNLRLTDAQVDELARVSDATVFRSEVKVWKVSTGGWFFLDQVPGRDDRITYAVGLESNGAVRDIEILVCAGGYNGITHPQWRGQFTGERFRNGGGFGDQTQKISLISGTTLSSAHVTEGVRRVLATYAMFLAPDRG